MDWVDKNSVESMSIGTPGSVMGAPTGFPENGRHTPTTRCRAPPGAPDISIDLKGGERKIAWARSRVSSYRFDYSTSPDSIALPRIIPP